MRIAFIEPSILNVEPLGIAYLAQSLINDGHEVRYFETPRLNFFKRLKSFNPEVLAYSVTTGKHYLCQKINSIIRRHIRAISLFGGAHCTFYPEFIENDDLIDGVCRGEGELAIVELVHKIEQQEDFKTTLNWWLRADGKIYKNPIREKIADLDSLPFPNREVIYYENMDLRDMPIKRILGARGCPFVCSYCFNKKYNDLYKGKGKVYRQRSTQNIVQEVKEIKKRYPITFLKFAEDIFGMEVDAGLFAETYGKEVRIPFICNIRPGLVNEYKIRKLKEAGCVGVTIAIESGNEFIRNTVLNRNLPYEVLSETVKILKNYGIRVWTQNIIANPGETFEMAMETYNFNVKHKVDFAECNILTPYPGTPVYEYCVKNNYFDGRVDTLPMSFSFDSVIHFDSKLEKRRLVNFQKFFSFSVKHPSTMFFIKFLIKMRLNSFFVLFNRLYDSWRVSRVIKAKFSMRSLFVTVRNNLAYIVTFSLKKDKENEFII